MGRIDQCRPAQLELYAYPGSDIGGMQAVVIAFHNASAAGCTMRGYPSASFLDSAGNQLGTGSTDLTAFYWGQNPSIAPPTTAILTPGGWAETTIWGTNLALIPSAACRPASATEVRVAPPGQSKPLLARVRTTLCSPLGFLIGTTPVPAARPRSRSEKLRRAGGSERTSPSPTNPAGPANWRPEPRIVIMGGPDQVVMPSLHVSASPRVAAGEDGPVVLVRKPCGALATVRCNYRPIASAPARVIGANHGPKV